jgi:hypothetical protein
MSENGISHLTYKRQRQEKKLQLAAEKRAATGRRSKLKKGLVPTLYTPSNNDSGTLKQITTGTLKAGRPWT